MHSFVDSDVKPCNDRGILSEKKRGSLQMTETKEALFQDYIDRVEKSPEPHSSDQTPKVTTHIDESIF